MKYILFCRIGVENCERTARIWEYLTLVLMILGLKLFKIILDLFPKVKRQNWAKNIDEVVFKWNTSKNEIVAQAPSKFFLLSQVVTGPFVLASPLYFHIMHFLHCHAKDFVCDAYFLDCPFLACSRLFGEQCLAGIYRRCQHSVKRRNVQHASMFVKKSWKLHISLESLLSRLICK